MLRRTWAVIRKEFIHTFRDVRTLLILLALPIIQLFLLGYAMSMNVEHIPMVVADQSFDAASYAYVDAMTTTGYFDVVAYLSNQAEVMDAIDAGRAQAGIVIPSDFATQVERGGAQVLFMIDGSDLLTAQSAYRSAAVIAQEHSIEVMMERVTRSGQAIGALSLLSLDARVRVLYNPNMDDMWALIPPMVAMLLQTQSILMTAAAVVREREQGTMEQLLVTPIRPLELMIGKITPNLILSVINALTLIGLGVYWFDVPFRGNFGLFMVLSLIFVFCGLGMGLLVSTVAQNQKQTQQLTGLILLVGIMLGGFMLPRHSMPLPARILGNLFPLTHFIPIAQGIIGKGIGIELLWDQTIVLSIYAVVVMLIASRVFKQRLD